LIPEYFESFSSHAFLFCNNFVKFEVNKKNKLFSSFNGVLVSKDITKLIKYPFGLHFHCRYFPDTLKIIGEGAFRYHDKITGICNLKGIERIEKEAFFACKNLKYVTFYNNLKYIGESAFSSCNSIENITIPENVDRIESGAFFFCDNLITVNLPNNVSEEIIADHSFSGEN
jgi:hypothetical protein